MKNVINRAIMAKKKMIFTLVLAIVSSVWMTSEGACLPSVHTATLGGMRYYPGTLVKAALPCEPNMECPTCQALALEADNTLYYLTPYTPYAQSLLETIEQQWKENLRANVYGIRFSTGNAMYIEVYGIQVSEFGLFALCDEWNIIIEPFDSFSPYQTYKQQLTTDTVFRDNHWIKLQQGEKYLGALTEGLDASVFFTPANSTKSYTLYVFNANVGEEYPNVWIGGSEERYPEGGYKAMVEDIKNDTIFIKITCNDPDFERHMIWIKGVGMETGPIGWDGGIPGDPADPTPALLCAYKQGQQVYASYLSEKYGCEYNDDENQHLSMFPSDTRWHYVLNILTGEPEPIIKYYSIEPIDTLINNTRYQKIQNALFRSSGAKVWCALDSAGTLVERLVYDFDLQVGDSISITVGNENGIWLVPEKDPTYAKVTNVEYIKLADGRMARRLSYDYRSDDIEHIGSVKGILAPLSYPGHPDSWSLLLCCTRSDFLLYVRDDSGSSTVDPVDPNQIYATLTGDVLTVHNRTGAQVTFTLNNTSVNNVAARARKNGQPTTFTESISVELTEDGLYEIWLTSEEWNYSVFGTIKYVRSGTEITKEETSSTSKKVLRGTQILIEREGKTYTLTGQEVK